MIGFACPTSARDLGIGLRNASRRLVAARHVIESPAVAQTLIARHRISRSELRSQRSGQVVGRHGNLCEARLGIAWPANDADLPHPLIRRHGHGLDSGTPFDDTPWQASEWRDGKVVWWQTFASEAEALEAAGLEE